MRGDTLSVRKYKIVTIKLDFHVLCFSVFSYLQCKSRHFEFYGSFSGYACETITLVEILKIDIHYVHVL